MELIRLENKTPEVYTAQSRDFQLLCRLYDCVINGLKFDADNIVKVINTHEIRTNLLPLMQTKVGFFSNAHINDNALRLILETFPLMVKKKGSLQAIGWAMNVFLKILNLRVSMLITKAESGTQIYNVTLPDHTIILGLDTAFQDSHQILKDILKYILPAGFGYYLYFYSDSRDMMSLLERESVAIIYISDDLDSLIRNNEKFDLDIENRMIGNVALMEVAGNDMQEGGIKHIDIVQEQQEDE